MNVNQNRIALCVTDLDAGGAMSFGANASATSSASATASVASSASMRRDMLYVLSMAWRLMPLASNRLRLLRPLRANLLDLRLLLLLLQGSINRRLVGA